MAGIQLVSNEDLDNGVGVSVWSDGGLTITTDLGDEIDIPPESAKRLRELLSAA